MVKNFITPVAVYNGLSISHAGQEDFAAINYFKPNRRSHNIIHFVLSGKGVFKSQGMNFSVDKKLKTNTAFAVYQTEQVFYQSDPNDPMHYFWVGFVGEDSEKIMNYIGFTEEKPTLHIDNPQEIVGAFQELFAAWQTKQDYYLLLSAFFKLVYLLRKNNRLVNETLVLNTDNNIFRRAEEYLQQNIHQNVKVGDLVSALHIDRSYFTKIFKKRFHETPHQYIFRLRMRNAELLLVSTNYSITQIVELLDFTDTYSFCKQFKKCYHYSPSEYRKLHKENALY